MVGSGGRSDGVKGVLGEVTLRLRVTLRLSDPAHGIVTKTVHTTLPGWGWVVVGVRGWVVVGRGVVGVRGW